MKEMEEEGPIKLWTQSPLWNKLTTGESEKKHLQPAFSELITSLEKGSCGLIHLQDTHSTGFKLGKHHVKPGAVGLMTARAHPIPLEVAFFVELKSKKLPIEKAVGQVVRYCVILMKQCPPVFRERAVGVATNGRDTRLIEVSRDDIETQNYQCFNFDEFPLAQLLGTLLSQNKEFLLGANSLEPFEFNGETILPERPLSHGATSRVFVDNYKKVWKVARDEALFPVLEKEADLLQRFFREHITGVPTVTGQVSHGFCMEECGTLLRENRLLLRGLSHQYVDTLKLVGALNYVHRDLRPANLLVCNGKALIIDWGFAVCCGINGYQGTIRYASFRVWKQLSANRFTVGTPTDVQLADDLESLVLSIAALSVAGYDKTVLGTQLQDIWTNVWDPIFSPTSAWSPLLDAARTCNYSELHRLFDALLFP
ncbi:hypothetical protein Pelo_1723 [Pelomyxa schiedti]|nr:hypothetical protein Pelo_1723 [Pelomyxa schiedti]